MVADADDGVGEPGLRVDAFGLGRFVEAVDAGGAIAALAGSSLSNLGAVASFALTRLAKPCSFGEHVHRM